MKCFGEVVPSFDEAFDFNSEIEASLSCVIAGVRNRAKRCTERIGLRCQQVQFLAIHSIAGETHNATVKTAIDQVFGKSI